MRTTHSYSVLLFLALLLPGLAAAPYTAAVCKHADGCRKDCCKATTGDHHGCCCTGPAHGPVAPLGPVSTRMAPGSCFCSGDVPAEIRYALAAPISSCSAQALEPIVDPSGADAAAGLAPPAPSPPRVRSGPSPPLFMIDCTFLI